MNRRFLRRPPSDSSSKPRVLIVDDHQRVIEAMSSILAEDFEIAGVATDGRQAVERAVGLEPDAVVLDIGMPGLDGFQTSRALQRAGSRAPIVFLSMYDGDDYVREAFRHGARGYVVKSRARRDLPIAIDQALSGRVFVPSLTPLLTLTNGSGHALHIHDGAEVFLDSLTEFLDVALQRGDATCIIATKSVREGVGERLQERGWDVAGPSGHKRCRVIDARDALQAFMRDGVPDGNRLAEVAAELDAYRRTAAEGTPARLTIFGTMSVALCEDNNVKGAIALENLWNTLTRDLPFFTLCGYPTSCFRDGEHELWSAVRDEHWALSHANDI